MIFHSHANKTQFHKKGCALGLILKVRICGTWKWPIEFRENVRAFFPQGQSKLSVTMGCPYYAVLKRPFFFVHTKPVNLLTETETASF